MKLHSVLMALIMMTVGCQPCLSEPDSGAADSGHPQVPPMSQAAFTLNKGQLSDPEIVLYSNGVYFSASNIVFRLDGFSFRIVFLGASGVRPAGEGMLPYSTNCFFGTDSAKWVTGADNFEKVVYHKLYDGIDLEYRCSQGGLKYEFRLAPGADLGAIRVRYEGATVATDGASLFIKTPAGTLTDRGLYAFQESGPDRITVGARIAVEQNIVSYSASYDAGLPLTIDPFIYSTFLGGAQDDEGMSAALDGSGNRVVAGITASPDFPTTEGGYGGAKGNFDLFVAKLSSDGTGLLFSTFIGGTGDDLGAHMALDSRGNIVLAGTTYSRDFPVTPGASPPNVSRSELYVLKLGPDGESLLFSSMMGGSDVDACCDLCLDSQDSIYLTGFTCSTDFPVTPGAYDTGFNGGSDAFALKLNSSGLGAAWSTLIGGDLEDAGSAIAVDTSGQCYITGETGSASFPAEKGYDISYNGGACDGFALKLAPSGDRLVYSTFLGGEKDDRPCAAVLTARGTLVMAGHTDSAQFPTTTGCCQPSLKGHIDCFALELNGTGSGLVFSTFLGGFWDDYAAAVGLDRLGSVLLAGRTLSGNYPVTDTNRSGYKEPETCFISKMDSNGSALQYSAFVGCGRGSDIFVSGANLVVLAGETPDASFPVTPAAYDRTQNGHKDAFLVCAELPSAPLAPGNLTALSGDREVRLAWSPPGNGSYGNITSYRIYRGNGPSDLSKIKDTASTDYADHGLTNGRQYFYAISAINEVGEGPDSTVVAAMPGTVPDRPQDFKASLEDGKVVLEWKQPGKNGGFPVLKYNVYKGLSASDMRLLNSTSRRSFQDDNVTTGFYYHYSVAAVNERGEGPPTATMPIYVEDVGTDEYQGLKLMMAVGTLLVAIAAGIVVFVILRHRRGR